MQHVRHWYVRIKQGVTSHKRRTVLLVAGAVVGALVLVQLCYPGDLVPLFTRVDGQMVGGLRRDEARQKLNTLYETHAVDIYMGDESKPVASPKLSQMDIHIDNTAQIDRLQYAWYLRLVPTSLFWAFLLQHPGEPIAPSFGDNFSAYVEKTVMPECRQEPVNATLKFDNSRLIIVPAKQGSLCEREQVMQGMKSIRPTLQATTTVRVAYQAVPPNVSDEAAATLEADLNRRLAGGVPLIVGGSTVQVQGSDVLSWLDFHAKDAALTATVNADRAAAWLTKQVAPKLATTPGTSYITTRDFDIVSQTIGANGQALDTAATIASIQSVVDGQSLQAVAQTAVVPPIEQYTRTYSPSDAGLSALMKNYAHDHSGTFGIAMVELDGKKRRADYNGDTQFVTASTYKLFVAYSVLKQIDAGSRSWDQAATCFNKMISYSDNACAEGFLYDVGLKTVTNDVQAIGLKNSTFMKTGGPFTTANDLALELGMIATGQNFSAINQQRLIAAMKANVYRSGIPAGVNGTVADKVGFMNGLLHDGAIVYGPNGTYVLAIMTDGASWASIADLAKQIDQLHAQ